MCGCRKLAWVFGADAGGTPANARIYAYTLRADTDDTAEVFKRMLKTGVDPDEAAYSTLTNALVDTDELKTGQGVLR